MTRFPRRFPAALGLSLIMLVVVSALACTESASVSTSTPTPTAEPTPTPLASQPRSLDINDEDIPAADPERLAKLFRLFSAIPGDYSGALYLDLAGIKDLPQLKEALDLEALGLGGSLPPLVGDLLDTVVAGIKQENHGVITVVEGPFDINELLGLASGFGFSLGEVETSAYREHEISSLDILGESLAFATLDDSATVFAAGTSSEGPTPRELIEAALDAYDQITARFLDDEEPSMLINNLPSGLATIVARKCTGFDLTQDLEVPGCLGAAASADIFSGDLVVLHALLSFSDEELAQAAFVLIRAAFDSQQSSLPFEQLGVRQEGTLVRIRLVGDPSQIEQVFGALDLGSG